MKAQHHRRNSTSEFTYEQRRRDWQHQIVDKVQEKIANLSLYDLEKYHTRVISLKV